MRAPGFWMDPDARLAPALLSPFCWVTARATATRLRQVGWRASVPVICCGNLGVGGAGKTTLALDLLQRLHARGIDAHALTRGYGGCARGILRVDPARHDAGLAGDEALLLAECATTWVAADRVAAARAAIDHGAQCLVMDDGMQNPGLAKDCTLLVIDGAVGFGNGRLLPAGPLRESIRQGAARARAAVLIGPDQTGALGSLGACLPTLRASMVMSPQIEALRSRRLAAFAGLARPQKFFAALRAHGLDVVAQSAFPDHHRYRGAQLRRLAASAAREGAILVTTPKDAVRLPAGFRRFVTVLGVGLEWEDPAAVESLLDAVLASSHARRALG